MWDTLVRIVGVTVLVCTGITSVFLYIFFICKMVWERVVCRKKNACTNKRCPFYPDCFRVAISDEEWKQILLALQNETKEND